jgi:hypothetical protein
MLTFKNKLKTLSVEQLEQLTEHLNKIEDYIIEAIDDGLLKNEAIVDNLWSLRDTLGDLIYDSNCVLSDKTDGRGDC